jgi:hypothetical protein
MLPLTNRAFCIQYYTEVLGHTPTSLFQTQFGVLLRDDIHHAFDRGHIALYPLVRVCFCFHKLLLMITTLTRVANQSRQMNTENELVVHIFYPETQSQRDFHGKVIRPEIRFRGPPDDYPDTQMLLFHYQQCVIKCFRGWSAF